MEDNNIVIRVEQKIGKTERDKVALDAVRYGKVHSKEEFANMHLNTVTSILIEEFKTDNPDYRFDRATLQGW